MKGLAKHNFRNKKQRQTNTQISVKVRSKRAVKDPAVLTFPKWWQRAPTRAQFIQIYGTRCFLREMLSFHFRPVKAWFFFIAFESSSVLTGTPKDEGHQRERVDTDMDYLRKIVCLGQTTRGTKDGTQGKDIRSVHHPG